MFQFEGPIIHSKSWYNRMQIVRFFNSNIELNPKIEILSDDVQALENALADFKKGLKEFHLGLGGTSFRFFCYLISRQEGEWGVRASSRLLARPQMPLLKTLRQLGVEVKVEPDGFRIISKSWIIPDEIIFDREISTQFISGLLLSSWDLPKNLNLRIQKPILSYDYLRMTIDLLRRCGMEMFIENHRNELLINILPEQKPSDLKFEIEPDVSSTFSLAACAVVDGDAKITNWIQNSIQPDIVFLELFKQMNISFVQSPKAIHFTKHNSWDALEADLKNSPDLFPVLAALCASANGKSKLFGAAQLRDKESDRVKKTCELLSICNVHFNELPDGVEIFGRGRGGIKTSGEVVQFNPDHDHRMAMAAALMKLAGAPIEITDPQVVNKSYPNFWNDIGVKNG